jgi:hypothetical protein
MPGENNKRVTAMSSLRAPAPSRRMTTVPKKSCSAGWSVRDATPLIIAPKHAPGAVGPLTPTTDLVLGWLHDFRRLRRRLDHYLLLATTTAHAARLSPLRPLGRCSLPQLPNATTNGKVCVCARNGAVRANI